MAHRMPRKRVRGSSVPKSTLLEGNFCDVGPSRSQSRLKGTPSNPTQGKKSSAAPSHAARQTRLSTRLDSSQNVGQSPKGQGAGTASLTTKTGGSQAASRSATRLGSQHQPSALGEKQSQAGSRQQAGRAGSDIPSSGVSGQLAGSTGGVGSGNRAQKRVTSLKAASVFKSCAELTASKQPGGVGRQVNIKSADSAQVLVRETRVGKSAAGHSVSQHRDADQSSSGRALKNKLGHQSYKEQSSSHSQSTLSQQCQKAEPPSKRICLQDSRPVGKTDRQLLGKKSFLRRAQEDMLASSSTSMSRSGGETTTLGSRAGLSSVQDMTAPLTRRSLNRHWNSHHGTARGSGRTAAENKGELPRPASSLGSQKLSASSGSVEMMTRGRKKGREEELPFKLESGSLGNGSSASSGSVEMMTRGRKRGIKEELPFKLESGSLGNGSSATSGSVEMMTQGRKRGREEELPFKLESGSLGNGSLQAQKQLRASADQRTGIACSEAKDRASQKTPYTQLSKMGTRTGHGSAHCQKGTVNVRCDKTSRDRPKRSMSQRKKCECCEFGEEHFTEGSFVDSDTELEKIAGKDKDLLWRSSVRAKVRRGAARKASGRSRNRNRKSAAGLSSESLASKPNQYLTYAYPVHLHTVVLQCSEEDKPSEAFNPDVEKKTQPGSGPQKFTYNQNAKLPGEIAYMEEDFYVVVADSDAEEDISARDTTIEAVKQESLLIDSVKQEIADIKQESLVLDSGNQETKSMMIKDFRQNADTCNVVTARKEENGPQMTSGLGTANQPCKDRKPAIVVTPDKEGSVEAEFPATAQKEDKENFPLTASSSVLNKQIQKSSLTAQMAELHSRSPGCLSAEKQKETIQCEQPAETEAQVHGRKQACDSGVDYTPAAEAVETFVGGKETGVNDQLIEPRLELSVVSPQDDAGQKQAVSSSEPEPQLEGLFPSPEQVDYLTQQCLTLAVLERPEEMMFGQNSNTHNFEPAKSVEGDSSLQANIHKSEPAKTEEGPSTLQATVSCEVVPEINIPTLKSASDYVEENDGSINDNTAGKSCLSSVEDWTCGEKDQVVVFNMTDRAVPGESPELFDQQGKSAGLNLSEVSYVVDPRDRVLDLVATIQENAAVSHCRGENAGVTVSAGISEMGEISLLQTPDGDSDSVQDDEVMLIPEDIPDLTQADSYLTHDHRDPTGYASAENNTEGSGGNNVAAESCDMQENFSTITSKTKEMVHTVGMIYDSGQENSEQSCMDVSAAENYSLESLPSHSLKEDCWQGSSNTQCTVAGVQ